MMQDTTEKLEESLETVFGFSSFRPGQRQIIEAISTGSDVLAIMPTGGGKSLCYQLPATLMSGTCIVVSPLIALMKDQVDAACANGIQAAALTSSHTEPQRREVLRQLRSGVLRLLYVSPERFGYDHFIEILQSVPLSFIAVDEAHCICSWGHDFRPDYLQLNEVMRQLPDLPVAAFTASATSAMQQEIIRLLKLRDPYRYCGSFNRNNLFYDVATKYDAERQIFEFVKRYRGESGIVYRTTRDSVEQTAELLSGAGISALPYHAGLSDLVRKENQEAFSRDRVEVVVATIAFGMGIDKSNVRYVVHGDLPRSLEHYYQETGRAGRDGESAHCYLLFSRSDIPRLHYFIDQVDDEEIATRHRIALAEMVAFASRYSCRRRALLAHFGEVYKEENCHGCDICKGEHEKKDITRYAQMLLSAIVRTDERFGARHIIDIVRGADTARIRSCGHKRLKTYGAGKESSTRELRDVFDAMLGQDICTVTEGQYPLVKLLPDAQEVLKGTRSVEMLCRSGEVASHPASGHRSPLFDQLRLVRRELADEQSVPPFVIFSDRTLHEMAQTMPCSAAELLGVTGVGHAKLSRYGERFIKVIQTYAEQHPTEEGASGSGMSELKGLSAPRKRRNTGESATLRETAILIGEGRSLAQIATVRGCTEGTVATHVERLFSEGNHFSITRLIDQELCEVIKKVFTRLQTFALKPVVEASDGRFGYNEAKIVRAWMQYEAREE